MPLTVRVMGPLEIRIDGHPVDLPKSRKTRALLAYLATNPRSHRRERLCELLWDVPDDPKGALRWSLSKLRGLVDAPDHRRILADRETVSLDSSDVTVDLLRVRDRLRNGAGQLALEELEALAAVAADEFLEGLELPDLKPFQAWCVAERENARMLGATILRELVARLADEPARALPHARALVAADPYDLPAWAALVRLLNAAGRRDEAAAQSQLAAETAREMGPAAEDRLRQLVRQADPPLVPAGPAPPDGAEPLPPVMQEVRFCTAGDGVRLAYACVGEGPPLVKVANWLSHLEFDWDSPVWRHVLREMCRSHQLVRYDERGMGLSDWDIGPPSLDQFVLDLETVVATSGVGRFALLGVSQGATVAIEYAARHPERVSHLILYGGYAKGWRRRNDPAEIERREAMLTLMRNGWGGVNPAFRQLFTSLFLPGGTHEQMQWFNDLQRISTSPEYAAIRTDMTSRVDVSDRLSGISVPTLVIHCRDDAVVPFQAGIELAKSIPDARFKALDGCNHLILESDAAWPQFVAEIRQFLGNGA